MIALYLTFAAAVALLIASPGPVAMLVVHDARYAWPFWTIAGGVVAALVLMGLALSSLHLALDFDARLLNWGRVLGGLYLLWLGFACKPGGQGAPQAAEPSAARRFWRGLGVGLSNPKDILFFLAFLPGFILPAAPLLPQALLLMLIWALLDISIMAAYGSFARRWLSRRFLIGTLPRYCLLALGAFSVMMGVMAL
ncbi:LysE family transporter [Stutzerimonas kirkiae]|uniref:LysE family transporter n=1 Tax=Stutzerimonas kirkiae TaxID=2211392 RepID=UPI0010383239|nr:LysE family transporter [Stutzerimonas kirkiae]TBV15816.1 lysine transporter LysE [Stutzerimonas kirkiae]